MKRAGNPGAARTDAMRAEAAKRVLRGEWIEVVAFEIDASVTAVKDWIRGWTERCGRWYGANLTVDELREFEPIEPTTWSRKRVRIRRKPRKDALRERRHTFIEWLHSPPHESRDGIAAAFQGLDDEWKQAMRPALDAYLFAADLHDESKRLRAEAVNKAMTLVVGEPVRNPVSAASNRSEPVAAPIRNARTKEAA